jgi:hypothetical protein
MRLVDKESVGETPTGATETVALPGTQELSANRIGMVYFFVFFVFFCGKFVLG